MNEIFATVGIGSVLLLLMGFILWRSRATRADGIVSSQLLPEISRLRASLNDAAAKTAAILEAAADGIVTIDEFGDIQSFNKAAEHIFGYTSDQVIGKNLKMLMPEPYHSEHDGYIAAYKATKRAKVIGTGREVTGLRRDGSTFPMDLTVGESRIGDRTLFAGIVRDITERKRTEEREAIAAAVLEAAVDGIITIDDHGRIRDVNPAAERIFGYARDEMIGHNVNMLMPEPYHAEHDDYLSHYRATGKPRIIGIGREVTGRRKDGTTFPMDLAVGESRNGGSPLFAGIVRDITERKRIEEGEAVATAVLEAAVDGIITIDDRGKIESFNRAAERIFGYSASEVIGQNVNILMPEPYHGEHDGYLSNYRHSHNPKIIGIGREVMGRRKDGTTFPMDLAVGESGLDNRILFAGIVRDITETKQTREQLRRSEESFRLLVDNVRDYAITWLDTQGRIATWNAGAERLYGWSAEEAINRPIVLLDPPEARADGAHILPAVRESGRYDRETWKIRKDGSRFWAHVIITPLWDEQGNMRGYVQVAKDMTDRKRNEEDLRQAKNSAELANIAKSKFLAAASHDLRQPVQAMVYFTSALTAEMANPSAQSILHDLKASLDGVNLLLNSLLDVSRLDAGIIQPKLVNFSLSTLFERVQAEFMSQATDKQLGLKVIPTSAIVRSDPLLLERIVQNLVSNAIRYTESGRILVGCRTRGQTLTIEVWDQGIGIPPDRLDDIFQEFYQVGNTERDRTQGLGLGLAIVKRLSSLLDHQVQVKSTFGKGSVFQIILPLVGSNRERKIGFVGSHATPAKPIDKGLVLIIDDEVLILAGLEIILKKWGYLVMKAVSEADALDQLSKTDRYPDIILADYRLRAGKTGIEAIRHIRVYCGNRPIPSVVITGDTAPERLKEAEASGYKLMHKPVSPPSLQAVLETYRNA